MNELLIFVMAGLVSGSIYGLAAMGLVVTYKTSGLFNFAHGTVAAVGAFAFYTLREQLGMPWPLAAVICLFVIGPLMGLSLERLARSLQDAQPAMKIVATVGLILAIAAALMLIYGNSNRDVVPFLSLRTFPALGIQLGFDQLIIIVLAAGAASALSLFFRRATLGIAMRGVVDDPALIGLTGMKPERVRRAAWVIGSTIAAASGILIAPTIGLDAYLLTLLVVQAFGAAAIGRFSSLPLTYLGGLAVGVASSLATGYLSTNISLSGVAGSIPFLVLFIVLLVTPRRLLPDVGALRTRQVPRPSGLIGRPLLAVSTLAIGVAALLPLLAGNRITTYTQALAFVPIFLSLGLLVWTSGQVSLAHAAFVALGATTCAHLSPHMPWFVALVLAGLVCVPVGALIAVPAIRLSGLYLALATFGFGVLMQNIFYKSSLMFGTGGTVEVPRPGGLGLSTDRGYYYAVLMVAVLAGALVTVVHRSRIGLLLRALADSPVALSTLGGNVVAVRVVAFCVSAFLAGVGGVLLGGLTGTVNGAPYGPFTSLTWLAVLALFGAKAGPARALAAAAALIVAPAVITEVRPEYFTLLFGVSAIVAALSGNRRRQLTNPHEQEARELRRRLQDRLSAGPMRTKMLKAHA